MQALFCAPRAYAKADAEDAQVIVRSYLTQAYEQSVLRLGGDRHDSSLEADVILELTGGRWAAYEIKLRHDKVSGAGRNLLALERNLMCDDRGRVAPPTFLAG